MKRHRKSPPIPDLSAITPNPGGRWPILDFSAIASNPGECRPNPDPSGSDDGPTLGFAELVKALNFPRHVLERMYRDGHLPRPDYGAGSDYPRWKPATIEAFREGRIGGEKDVRK